MSFPIPIADAMLPRWTVLIGPALSCDTCCTLPSLAEALECLASIQHQAPWLRVVLYRTDPGAMESMRVLVIERGAWRVEHPVEIPPATAREFAFRIELH
jgi:hypothetical protein